MSTAISSAPGPEETNGTQNKVAVSNSAPERLIAATSAFCDSGFAVLNGGQFDDLPGLLRKAGLFGRSLFLDHADVEVERAGPWLVGLDQRADAVEHVFGMVGRKPAAVFWSCAEGEAVLYRHLRTLNMTKIPVWAAEGGEAPPEDQMVAQSESYEAVLHRHWDPRVLGALLPVLDAGQFRRFVGPAGEIAFWAEDYGGLKRVVADPDWPQAPGGMLTLRSEQMLALSERRVAASHRRIAIYLRNVAAPQTADIDDETLLDRSRKFSQEAQRFGVKSEREIFLWSFMQATSLKDLAHEPGIMRYLANPQIGTSPEDRMRKLFAIRLQVLG